MVLIFGMIGMKDLLPKNIKAKIALIISFKETDNMDVWFDSGTSYEVLKERGLPFPADYI